MKGKLGWSIFWMLVATFVATVGIFAVASLVPTIRGDSFLWFIIISGTLLFLLGVALIVLTVKEKVQGTLKRFLILTGASSAGIFVSVLLHNAIYGLVYVDILNRPDLDEFFFFIMAIFICPLAFLVGVVGSIVLIIKSKQVKYSS